MSIISFILSFFSPSFYRWVAHERGGLGMTYLFGLTLFFFIIFTAFFYFYTGQNFAVLNAFMTGFQDGAMRKAPYLAIIFTNLNSTLGYIAGIFLASIGISISLTNLAIIYAMYGMIFNIATNAKLGFEQVVRIASYAQIPATLVMIGVFFGMIKLNIEIEKPGIMLIVALLCYSFYMLLGIFSAKKYFTGSKIITPQKIR